MNNDKRWQGTTHPIDDLQKTREIKMHHKRQERMGSVARKQMRTHEEVEFDEAYMNPAHKKELDDPKTSAARKKEIKAAYERAARRAAMDDDDHDAWKEKRSAAKQGRVYHEETELDETLNIQQRQKRAAIMRRYKSKIERGREVAKSRIAGQSNIKKRAYAQARQIFRKKLAGEHGAEYEKLGPSEKMAVDKLLDNKGKAIKKLALRLIPKVKRNEYQRLQSYTKGHALMNKGVSEEFNDLFLEYFGSSAPGNSGSTGERTMNPITSKDTKSKKTKAPQIKILGKFTEEYENDTAISRALENKADKAGIDLAIIGEVYDRGLEAWSEQYNVSPTQYAFARVNSFINKGKTYYNEDADLVEETIDELSKSTLKSYIDKTNDPKEFTGSLQKFMSRGKGYRSAKNKLKGTANVPATNEETELDEAGLWANIHAKRKRIKAGSGERMRKPGSKGAPSAGAIKAAQESVEIDEAGSKYNIPMARSKPKTSTGRTFGSVLDEVDVPVKHLDRARSVWNRTKDVEAVKKFVSGVKEEVELDELSAMTVNSARRGIEKKVGMDPRMDSAKKERHLASFKTGTKKVLGLARVNATEEVMKDKDPCWKGYQMVGKKTKNGKQVPNCVPEETEFDESNNTPYVKPHIEKGSTKQSGWKASNKHGNVKYFGNDFKKSAEKHAGIDEAKDPNRNTKLRQGMQYVERDITPETPDSDAVPPTSIYSDAPKQQRVKKRIIEQSAVEVNPAKRLIGTDSLVKVYKKATPGQSLDESFTMAFDYQGKPTLAPTASELHMQAKGGFAHHTDVQNVMEVTDIKNKIQAMFETTILEEDKDQLAISYDELSNMVQEAFGIIEKIKASTLERDAWSEAQILKMERYIESVNAYLDNMYEDVESGLKSPVVVPAHNDQYGNPIPAKTVLRKTGRKIIKTGNTFDGKAD